LDQLETSFLNNSSVTLNLSGMAISDEGDVSFEIVIDANSFFLIIYSPICSK
jgi:hypothetical protein